MAFDYKPRDYDQTRLDDGRIVRVYDDGRIKVLTGDEHPVYSLRLPSVTKAMDLMDAAYPVLVSMLDIRKNDLR